MLYTKEIFVLCGNSFSYGIYVLLLWNLEKVGTKAGFAS
jgi:hypothetical protein